MAIGTVNDVYDSQLEGIGQTQEEEPRNAITGTEEARNHSCEDRRKRWTNSDWCTKGTFLNFLRVRLQIDLSVRHSKGAQRPNHRHRKKSTSDVSFSWDVVAVIPNNSVPCAKQVTPDLMGPPGDRLSTDQTHGSGTSHRSHGQPMTQVLCQFPIQWPHQGHRLRNFPEHQGDIPLGHAALFEEQSHRSCGLLVLPKDHPTARAKVQTMTRKKQHLRTGRCVFLRVRTNVLPRVARSQYAMGFPGNEEVLVFEPDVHRCWVGLHGVDRGTFMASSMNAHLSACSSRILDVGLPAP